MIFSLILGVFLFTPSNTLWDTLQDFANWKTLLKCICGKFHQYSICRCEIKNCQVFFVLIQHPRNSPIWDFLGAYSPKYCLIMLKLWSEVAFDKKNSIWEILQNLEFWLKRNAVNVYIFGPYRGPIYCWKTKNITKNQNFHKNCILSND